MAEEKRVLTPTQKAFVTSREPYPAFVGGYGSGKSAAGIARAMSLKAHFPKQSLAYYLPTYPLVEDIAFRRFPELCERKGWDFKLTRGNSPGISFPGAGSIFFRTMDNPDRIVGYEVAHSILDEIDTLPTDKAKTVWNRVIARNRERLPDDFPNTVGVVTTPEGFRFVWEMWEKIKRPGYVLFRAKTEDNSANLPPGYIENLRNTYPSNLLQAYLDGEFVNLSSGSVYPSFDRRNRNRTNELIQQDEILHIGMDFNVGKMSAIVHVIRNGEPRALDEVTGVLDTPKMLEELGRRYPRTMHPTRLVYPDASGRARKSNNASESDLSLIRGAQFYVCVNNSNPAVKDRVLSMNKNFESGAYKVNIDKCPIYTESLEKQPYDKNGEPDKAGGLDHTNDAGGYFIAYRFPVVSRKAIIEQLEL